MRNGSGNINPATGGWTFNQMGNGAGGWCTRIDVATDGYEVVGTDTIGPLIRGPSDTKWTSLLNPGVTVTAAELDAVATAGWGDDATYDVTISKANSNYLYFVQHGFVWKSTDRGANVTRTARAYDANLFASAAGGSGGSVRMSGKRLAIDPAVSTAPVVALGHQVDGLYYTTDSGTTWTKNTGIPAPTGSAKNVFIAYDTTSATAGSPLRYQTVYVYSAGNGVYKSTTGISGTFTLMTGSPTAASVLICAGGKPFIAGAGGNSPATVQFYNGTSWTSSGISAQTLCFNPADTTKMWALNEGGTVYYSSNSGASFTNVTSSMTRAATDIPWLAWANEAYMSNGDVIYNPNTNLLTFAEGIGVWSMTPPTAAGALTWTSKSLGINNLVAQHIRVTSAGRVITSSQDRAFFAFSRTGAGTQALTHGVANGPFSINPGQTTDYAIDDPNFLVGVTGNNGVATSSDGGKTWAYIANQPPATSTGYWGGNIVCGNKTNWILFQTSSGSQVGKVHYTLDGGQTWAACTFNATYDGLINWHGAYYLQRVIVVADKANPGTFYAYMVGDGSQPTADAALKGVWKTTTGGASWTRVCSSTITSADGFNGKLKINAAGHLTWTAGVQGGDYDTPTNINLMFSTDGGASWNAALTGIIEPADFAWGMAKPGANYQTGYIYGWVSGVRGLYRVDDFNPSTRTGTPVLIDRWPATLTGGHVVLEADPNAYGRVYIGNSVQGFGYGDYTDAATGT